MGHDRPADSSEVAALWNARYGSRDQPWTGAVNARLVSELDGLAPHDKASAALDAGCGEGGDSLWLAEQGWQVFGVDLSSVAIDRARDAAHERGLGARVRLEQRDLSTTPPPEAEFDLVTAHYLHVLPDHRDAIYGGLARAVRLGGTLLLVLHDASNIDAGVAHPPPFTMLTRDELAAVAHGFRELSCEQKPRAVLGRDGSPATAYDLVLRAVR